MGIPKETQDRIKADADKAYPIANGWHTDYAVNMGYIAGATAENERAQRIADALDRIGNGPFPITQKELEEWLLETKSMAREALQQFKDGKGVAMVRKALYKGDEFPDYVGYEVDVEDDYTEPNAPCYKIYLEGEWIGNMDDEDLEFKDGKGKEVENNKLHSA